MKKVNIPALITTIIYFLCFFVLVFFVRKFNFALWIVFFLIYGVPIIVGAYKGIRESNFFKKLLEGLLSCLFPFISFYFLLDDYKWTKFATFFVNLLFVIILGIGLLGVHSQIEDKKIISFETRGGSSCKNIQTSGNEEIDLPTSSRNGYYFVGWYTSTNWDKKVDETTYENKSLTSNITLYARWGTIQEIEITPSNYSKYLDIKVERIGNGIQIGNNLPSWRIRVQCQGKRNDKGFSNAWNSVVVKNISLMCNGELFTFNGGLGYDTKTIYAYVVSFSYSNVRGIVTAPIPEE